jgi:hypothetical protein
MELVYGIAGLTLLLLLFRLFSSRKTNSGTEPDPVMEEIAAYIDSTLQGYPDRFRHKGLQDAYGWTCHSRLFTIQIHLEKERTAYRLRVYFFRQLPYLFLATSGGGKKLQVTSSKGSETKTLLGEKEITSLLEKMEFYDKIEVYEHGVTGAKKFKTLEELSGWHKVLGATITFTRFLLHQLERKQPSALTDALCPYCRGPMADSDLVVSCSECRTRHHGECWNETDRCSVFGCGGKSELQV